MSWPGLALLTAAFFYLGNDGEIQEMGEIASITNWTDLRVRFVATGTVGSAAFSVLSSSFGAGPSTESGRVAERLDEPLLHDRGESRVSDDQVGLGGDALAKDRLHPRLGAVLRCPARAGIRSSPTPVPRTP